MRDDPDRRTIGGHSGSAQRPEKTTLLQSAAPLFSYTPSVVYPLAHTINCNYISLVKHVRGGRNQREGEGLFC